MSEEQYNAMTPEQQAAYWHQWQQYAAQQQYYPQGQDQLHMQQQHDQSAQQYAQDPNYQAHYAQYQVMPDMTHASSCHTYLSCLLPLLGRLACAVGCMPVIMRSTSQVNLAYCPRPTVYRLCTQPELAPALDI